MDKVFKYIEIKEFEGGKVIKRFDVTDKSYRTIGKIEDGMNIQLNHSGYYTLSFESETELPTI